MNDSDQHDKVQGEGNYDAARDYDKAVTQHAQDADAVAKQARDAQKALDGGEAAELARAEEAGRAPARD